MSAVKLYFCTFYDDGPTQVSVHRDLNTLLDEWEQCDKSTAVGLVHVGFVRPKVLNIPKILIYKGQVLCTGAAKWALPLEYVCSHSVLCELDISGAKVPIHLAMQGFGYNAEEPGGMVAIAPGRQETNGNGLTIANAAMKVLENAAKPQSKEEIYANIVEEGLYQFVAKKPVSVLAVELNRHCLDTDYSNPASEPIFGKTHDGNFFALTNAPQELEDWLVDLEHDEPQLLKALIPYGICSEKSYINSAHNLSRSVRDKLDIYRYHSLSRTIDMGDPEHYLKILPESLRRLELSLLGLTVRLTNIFKQQSVHCLADLDGVSLTTMMGWSNFGRKSAKDLCEILSKNFEKLMDQASMAQFKQAEIKDLDVDEGFDLDENYQIEKISAIPLKNHFENALAQLKDRDRVIIEHRTGYHGKVMTLDEVGKLFDVTRERVRQLQKKYVAQILEREFWDDCIAIKIGQLLVEREDPLYLEMLELEDAWFSGFMGNYTNLAAIIELFSEAEIRIIKVNGANIVTRIKQDYWDTGVSQFGKSLKDKAEEGGWTRGDINLTFKSFLADAGAEELLSLMWVQFEGALQFSGETDEDKLIGFGRTAEAAVSAVLTQAEKPLHYSEIAERASEVLGRPVNERLAHNATPRLGGKLFGRGVYGLSHLNPLSDRMCNNIRLVVSKIIYDGPLMKQWHCGEIITQLKVQFPSLPPELDHYILNMILENEKKLNYLNRMVWARADSGQSKDDRVDMADAFTRILEENGGPLKGSEIKSRLQGIRGVTENLQIQPTDRMILLGRDYWGLIDRDVAGTVEGNKARLDVIYSHLHTTQKGIHYTEVDELLSRQHIPGDAPEAYTLLNLAQRDERFYLARAMFLGLAEWGENVRRLNVTQAVRKIIQEMSRPMSIAAINAKVESLTGLDVDNTVTGLLISEGGKYDPSTKLWWKDDRYAL
ncbi:sigma factor-like helix-turn-helix DNA-binding protein [Vibrio parahaemolyticus]|uniref:sigma factor-like helix-turn-helix DNA-binding protein n=2 Tax=Vibrio parahaemolyticus TaxID=670 RepID=UPI002362E9DC|nr:sigma factor-like helix-turn-helix DNA-binding protein [Vibrio parahaemolyticus]MEA5291080.1 sigma factor-like helix-turn-helix DNA-binding protein [Vibrio parahaemolyticus]